MENMKIMHTNICCNIQSQWTSSSFPIPRPRPRPARDAPSVDRPRCRAPRPRASVLQIVLYRHMKRDGENA